MYLINGSTNSPDIEKKTLSKKRQSQAINKAAKASINNLDEYLVLPNGTTRDDLQRFIKRFENCSSEEIYAEFSNNGEKKHRRMHSNACNETRFCKICANKKQAERYTKMKSFLEDKQSEYPHIYLLTLTQKNTDNLYEAISSINNDFRRWYKLSENDRTGEYGKVRAGVKSVEVKRGKNSGKWHVHIHALLFCSDELDYKKWDKKRKNACVSYHERIEGRKPTEEELIEFGAALHTVDYKGKKHAVSKIGKEWHSVSGSFIVDCKPVFLRKKNGAAALESAVKEVLKYQTKITEYEAADLATIFDATKGSRAFEFLGELRTAAAEVAQAKKRILFLVSGIDKTINTIEHRDKMLDLKFLESEKLDMWEGVKLRSEVENEKNELRDRHKRLNNQKQLLNNEYKQLITTEETTSETKRLIKETLYFDDNFKKKYGERVKSAVYKSFRWDEKEEKYTQTDVLRHPIHKIAAHPVAVSTLFRKQGELVSRYNQEVTALKQYIGVISNQDYVEEKRNLYDTLKRALKYLWNTLKQTTDYLSLIDRMSSVKFQN